MQIMHLPGEHVLVLSDEEAAALADACALLVLASQAVSQVGLQPGVASVLGKLFGALTSPAEVETAAHLDI